MPCSFSRMGHKRHSTLPLLKTKSEQHTCTHARTRTQLFNSPLSGTNCVGRHQKKHSSTHTNPDHQTSFINFLHLLRSIAPPSSIYVLDSPFPQPLSRSSLVFLLVLDPLLHTPCISSPNCHLLFPANTHTIARSLFCCNTALMLCHLYLISLSVLYLEICLLPFRYWLTRVVPEKGLLKGCVCVCIPLCTPHILFLLKLPNMNSRLELPMPTFCCFKPHVHY